VPAPIPPEPRPVPPAPRPRSYEEAIDFAKLCGVRAKVFLYFGATWCQPCQQMTNKTLHDPQISEDLNNFIVWIADTDQEPLLAQRYRIRGIPCYFLIDADENIIRQASGYKAPDDFRRWLLK